MPTTKRGRLLIVDDEVELSSALCDTLSRKGFETTAAVNGSEGLQYLRKQDFDLLLTDLMMPGMNGIQLLREALEFDPPLVGIVMTGQGTVPSAVEAMKVGAFDYVLKPFELQTMLPILDRALETRRLRLENMRLRQYVERLNYESPRYQMIGSGPAMQKVVHLIEKVAATDTTVLIRGDSGTGKELVARALHHNSPRRSQPLVTINCAALQATLLESELFGHEKGAFTGAVQARPGLIEVAEGGTLFIDEVAEMEPGLQAKFLRVLEDKCYRRVGGTKECRADVRLIAATNKPLEKLQKEGRFREDLFYRLNVVAIDLPPLRDRREDIPGLIAHLLTTRQLGKVRCQVRPDAMQALMNYDWPGNIRELANVLERAQILAEDNSITLDDLPDAMQMMPAPADPAPAELTPADLLGPADNRGLGSLNMAETERRLVQQAMRQADGNKVNAAKALGISRRSLYRFIEKYRLEHTGAEIEARIAE